MNGAKARELRQAARMVGQTYGISSDDPKYSYFVGNAYKRMKKLFMEAKSRGEN